MARYSGGARQASAGTSTLPSGSLYAAAAVGGIVREIGVFNTTTTACVVALCRLTTAGTKGSTITVDEQNPSQAAASCVLSNTHTSTGPTLADLGYRTTLGAAAGAGIIWTFGDAGLVIPVGTGQGIGIYVPTGTGQVCDFYFVWDE